MLSHIELTNFRNFRKFSEDLAKTTIIYGENGQGKTNLIEAIFLIFTGKSFRTNKNNELVLWEQEFSRIEGLIDSQNQPASKKTKIEFIINLKDPHKPKTIKINEIKKKLLYLLGIQKTILFSPESLDIILGPPGERRRFLDRVLAQINFKYAKYLLFLSQILKNRNLLLEKINQNHASPDELGFWNSQLIKYGSFLITKRKELIRFLNQNLSDLCRKISGKKESFQIIYLNQALDDENQEKFLENQLLRLQSKEIAFGHSLVGPQRDNLKFLLNHKNLKFYGSRGEVRTAILALKLAEADFLIKDDPRQTALFLLDDVFSELDQSRRDLLTQIFDHHQIIITTTDLKTINPDLKHKAKIIEL